MSQCLVFERVEIRPSERVVLMDGSPVALGARAFDVLLALAERHERVVTKNELLDLAWPGMVVEENNLSVQISALRKVLGAGAIATVTGRGYRLALSAGLVAPSGPMALPGSEPPRLARRLVVLAQADVLGWSRWVARDALAAVQAWKSARTELIEPSVPLYAGELIELTPGRLLAAFGSAVQALDWALQLQRALVDRRESGNEAGLRMRIGLTVDDAIVDDGKLVGDGLSVAAELLHAAGHDEVLITQMVRDLVGHKLPVSFHPLGERLLRPLPQACPVFRVEPADSSLPALGMRGDHVASLAVLPLAAEEADGAAYFGEGMTEEIIASLSRNRALFVIAHSSTLRYRGRVDDPAMIAAELGVRYLLTGRLQRAGNRLRISVVLVQAALGQVIWQERYDGADDDVFAFQESIAASIAGAIDPQVQEAEIARAVQRQHERFDAYDCVLRAKAGMYEFERPEFEQAGDLLRRAVALDPNYAQAHAHLAWWHSLCIVEGRSPGVAEQGRLALDHAMRAVQLDARDAWALSVAGHLVAMLERRLEAAQDIFERALAINPGCAAAWGRSATTLAYLGRAEESLDHARRAMALSPFDRHTFSFFTTCGTACLVAQRPDEAVAWLGKALRLNPRYNAARRLQIAALMQAGDSYGARELAAEFVAAVPEFSVSEFGSTYPMRQPHLERLLAALRCAGLPD